MILELRAFRAGYEGMSTACCSLGGRLELASGDAHDCVLSAESHISPIRQIRRLGSF